MESRERSVSVVKRGDTSAEIAQSQSTRLGRSSFLVPYATVEGGTGPGGGWGGGPNLPANLAPGSSFRLRPILVPSVLHVFAFPCPQFRREVGISRFASLYRTVGDPAGDLDVNQHQSKGLGALTRIPGFKEPEDPHPSYSHEPAQDLKYLFKKVIPKPRDNCIDKPSRLAALPSCLLEHSFLEPSCHTVRKPRWPHGEAQVERTPLAIHVSEEDTLAGSMQSRATLHGLWDLSSMTRD
ncbi:uncharacterized protein LOC118881626 [Balaenoptera musculus]|uniref:Uncharacterized protein LOC118881626 n=1 Tax=Balaenoptera musculus TaxID=9771 RepID=A0A8B8VCT1_BALMU|nr:uncharacterized protein LOC118881626 [Balaenoptera musculus]